MVSMGNDRGRFPWGNGRGPLMATSVAKISFRVVSDAFTTSAILPPRDIARLRNCCSDAPGGHADLRLTFLAADAGESETVKGRAFASREPCSVWGKHEGSGHRRRGFHRLGGLPLPAGEHA